MSSRRHLGASWLNVYVGATPCAGTAATPLLPIQTTSACLTIASCASVASSATCSALTLPSWVPGFAAQALQDERASESRVIQNKGEITAVTPIPSITAVTAGAAITSNATVAAIPTFSAVATFSAITAVAAIAASTNYCQRSAVQPANMVPCFF